MKQLSALHIKNGLYYRDAVLRFDTGNVILVSGKNLNTPRKKSNGSGKSLFFYYVYAVFYGKPPVVEGRKRGQHRLLFKDDTVVTAFVETEDDRYRVVQDFKGLTIFKNGIDLKIRTEAHALQYLRDYVWPMTENEFRTMCYLSSTVPFVLQRGSDLQRMEFMESLFDLWLYDAHADHHKAALKVLKGKREALGAYADTELSIRQSIEALEVPEDTDAELLKEKNRALNFKINGAQIDLDGAQAYHSAHRLLVQAQTIVSEKPPEISPKLMARLEAMEAQEAAFMEARAGRSQLAEARAEITELEGRINEMEEGTAEAWDSLIEIRQAYEQEARAYQEEADACNSVPAHKCKVSAEQLASTQVKIQTLEVRARLARQIGEHHEGASCPLCGTEDVEIDVDAEAVAKELKSLKGAAAYIEAQLKLKLLKKPAEPREVRGRTLEALKMGRKEAVLRDRLDSQLENAKQRAKKSAAKIKDAPTKRPAGLKELRQQIDNHALLVRQWRQVERAQEHLDSLDVPKVKAGRLEAYIEHLTKNLRKWRSQVVATEQEIRVIETYEAKHSALAEQLETAVTQVRQHKKALRDVPILEALVEAYGNKGAKLLKVQQICKELAKHLNSNKHLLYREDLVFGFDIKPNSFGIMVNRKGERPADVRFLSGSEAQRWNQLLVLALCDMSPAAKRINLAILDEMVSNADEDTEAAFYSDFIPALKTKIDNVIVVSPKPVNIEGAIEVVATKKGTESRLITTHGSITKLTSEEKA